MLLLRQVCVQAYHMACKNPVVNVKQGQLRGVVEDNVYGEQYLAFRGIPYAKPPTGPLRFKDSQPPEPWTGCRDATKYSNVCAQFDFIVREVVGSDDCLYLNVYTPLDNAATKRSVMVWVHGGAFVQGSGDNYIYGPDYLIRKDIVLVTINYRLGILGFLNTQNEMAPGNQGLKDQVMALRWVKDNIASFGGDPENVTIFGESAGAASVHFLSISPMARGLFHKVIAQSGVALNPWTMSAKNSKESVFQLVAKLGKETTDLETAVEYLTTLDPLKIIVAECELLTPEDRFTMFGFFGPTVDDKSPNPFIPQHPTVLMKNAPSVPYLLGHNSNEGSFLVTTLQRFKDYDKINNNFEITIFPSTLDSLKKDGVSIEDLKRIYFGDQPIGEKTLQNYADLQSDIAFLQGIHYVAKDLREKYPQNTYFYKFCYETGESLMKQKLEVTLPGTTHAEDLYFLFFPHVIKLADMKPPGPGSDDYKVIEYFTQMWTDFAKTGNPTPVTTNLISTTWKPMGKGNEYNYLEITEKLQMKTDKLDEHTFNWKKMKNKL
ncbi:esterase FE4-like isoform X2 [Hylaeus anthracinus]|uniref:esterase FE4-like isoform X2 n=1 Tax=Hylaeus anthracinus TaxID=313031 RepID=UPI0023B8D7DF|nr:esterase FE4-like isoform X2 [Hylaeus anthracinus]